ncbi:hypothetical protein N657DRAFT_211436 [Parathielavia appendiculata]|uniref:Uncharacterized protein n=1 Tax=Parathielavia appendiculata TaxID=2587402 RepID=A0AAN6Z7G8_9PEZI|nr:hypothetical protein N657DRAFT_211436 [Parathielavia appendiculata]
MLCTSLALDCCVSFWSRSSFSVARCGLGLCSYLAAYIVNIMITLEISALSFLTDDLTWPLRHCYQGDNLEHVALLEPIGKSYSPPFTFDALRILLGDFLVVYRGLRRRNGLKRMSDHSRWEIHF